MCMTLSRAVISMLRAQVTIAEHADARSFSAGRPQKVVVQECMY